MMECYILDTLSNESEPEQGNPKSNVDSLTSSLGNIQLGTDSKFDISLYIISSIYICTCIFRILHIHKTINPQPPKNLPSYILWK